MKKPLNVFTRSAIVTALLILSAPLYAQTGPVTGAVFTTGPTCQVVNGNIYDLKENVYLDGGPTRPGSAGLLSLTNYYVQVTDPSGGTLLGSSVNNAGNKTPITTNSVGDVVGCFQLQSIVTSPTTNALGFDNTPNAGGEYKVWISTDPTFKNRFTKTDNFKVKGSDRPPTDTVGKITIKKFYDANVNGQPDSGEIWFVGDAGWRVDLLGFDFAKTEATYANLPVTGGQTYTAREYQPLPSSVYTWYATTPTPISTTPSYLNQQTVTLNSGDAASQTVTFGNVCTGPGGGLTIGFWSNKNGLAIIKANPSIGPALVAKPLVDDKGFAYDPYQPLDTISGWLLNATARNMAYMLSAQYAAMYMNIHISPNPVKESAIVYAAGTGSAATFALANGGYNSGFAYLSDVMTEAETLLAAAPYTPAGNPNRTAQELVKNALDMANNNRTFVQSSPCAYSFP